jgi:predicted DNA-binding transcriptional regulator AlpA
MSPAVSESAALPQRLLGVRDLARMVGASENTIRAWINEGRLPKPFKIGRAWKWHPDVIRRFLTAREG